MELLETEHIITVEFSLSSTEYNLGQLLGEGTCGKCFELTSSKNDKSLACKTIKKNFSNIDIEKIAKNEVEIHEKLQHQTQFFFEFDQCCSLIRQILSGYHPSGSEIE